MEKNRETNRLTIAVVPSYTDAAPLADEGRVSVGTKNDLCFYGRLQHWILTNRVWPAAPATVVVVHRMKKAAKLLLHLHLLKTNKS